MAVILAAATPAAAASDCSALVAAFDRAVGEKSIEGEVAAADAIRDDPVCGAGKEEFDHRLIDSMIALAGDPQVTADQRGKALERAERMVDTHAGWREAQRLADLFARMHDNQKAFEWYEKSLSFASSRPLEPAAKEDLQRLRTRAVAAQLLAIGEGTSKNPAAFVNTQRGMDVPVSGVYSGNLTPGGGGQAIRLPLYFDDGQAALSDAGEKALDEVRTALIEQSIKSMTLVGHADPRGDRRSNLDLSLRRAEAVRDYLTKHGVTARIEVNGVGADQPFDASSLDRPVSAEEERALDRGVDLVPEAAPD
jgi:flagellar motor protein MotB